MCVCVCPLLFSTRRRRDREGGREREHCLLAFSFARIRCFALSLSLPPSQHTTRLRLPYIASSSHHHLCFLFCFGLDFSPLSDNILTVDNEHFIHTLLFRYTTDGFYETDREKKYMHIYIYITELSGHYILIFLSFTLSLSPSLLYERARARLCSSFSCILRLERKILYGWR